MFILYWLYNPILELMDGLHAYQGLLSIPNRCWRISRRLCFSIFAFNIIGHVPGAAVAQMTFTHKIFGPMLMAAGVPPGDHRRAAGLIPWTGSGRFPHQICSARWGWRSLLI